ncbi:MAG: response regulator [Nitrospinota bacterium]|nr:response regulator [Nitrospinota bacterium]
MLKIILCEDDPLLRKTLKEFLNSLGHEVIEAVDGTEALDFLASQSVDMIVSDIHMPSMGGMALLEKLRSDKNMVPFILMTGKPEIESFLKGMHNFGAFDYIQKPFDFDLLVKMIGRLENKNHIH